MRYLVVFLAAFFGGCLPEVETIDPATIVEWKNFTIADGLAGNRVNAITTDRQGNLWLATDNGASRFDGSTFTNYRTGDGLLSNYVTSVIEFEPGVMVFGTDKGLCILDAGSWYYFTDLDGNGTPFVITALEVDADGYGWIGTDIFGLLLFDGSYIYWLWDNNCPECNYVESIYRDSQDNMWLATKGGLKLLQGNSFIVYDTSDGLPDRSVQSVFEDDWGNLWVGTANGLAKRQGNRFVRVSLYNSATRNWVYTICQDKRKRVWFGSIGQGLIYYDGVAMRTEPASLQDKRISTISSFRDKDGTVWFGTYEGGLYKYSAVR